MTPCARPLSGIIPPLVTPLIDEEHLDHTGLERLVEHILGGGVQGLFLLGTCGEGPAHGYRLRHELVERVCEQVSGRVPILVGVSDTSLSEAVEMAERAQDSGASAVVSTIPSYFPVSNDDVQRYFWHLADRSPLPLLLYNMPSCTKGPIDQSVVEHCTLHENIIGVKDSSGDLDYFDAMVNIAQARDDWTVLMGPEQLLVEAVNRGGQGGICGGANVCPTLFTQLYQAAVEGNIEQIQKLAAKATQLESIYGPKVSVATVVRGLKCALGVLGICAETMGLMYLDPTDKLRDQVRQQLIPLTEFLPSGSVTLLTN